MLIQEMTFEMSMDLLKYAHVGRIACVKNFQPYITPFSFTLYDGVIYSFTTIGKKVTWMRSNPLERDRKKLNRRGIPKESDL
jgi:nitroimidazol reductase NimA-like FMN-containing flavoprotein (pyridoxamine 5'-phosphate oxidase superfamily)